MDNFSELRYQLGLIIPKHHNLQASLQWALVLICVCASVFSAWQLWTSSTVTPQLAAGPGSNPQVQRANQEKALPQTDVGAASVQTGQATTPTPKLHLIGLVNGSGGQPFGIFKLDKQQMVLAVGESLPGHSTFHISTIGKQSATLSGPEGDIEIHINAQSQNLNKLAKRTVKLPQLRQLLLRNPQSISEHLHAQAQYAGENVRSLKLSPGNNPRLFLQAGLQEGDELTHVNSTPIADIGLPQLPGLLSKGRLQLKIKRNKQEHELSLIF